MEVTTSKVNSTATNVTEVQTEVKKRGRKAGSKPVQKKPTDKAVKVKSKADIVGKQVSKPTKSVKPKAEKAVSTDEKKAYCDAMYGKGRWEIMSKSDVIDMLKADYGLGSRIF